jgi:hypothetical protein
MQIKPNNLTTKSMKANMGMNIKIHLHYKINDFFHSSNVWMKTKKFTCFQYIKLPSKVWMNVLFYH